MADPQPNRRNGTGCIVAMTLGVVLLPIFYLASTGPAVLLAENNWIPMAWLMWLYFPVEWLAEHSETFKTIIVAYLDLWRG